MVSTAESGETCEATYVVSSSGPGVSVSNLHTVPVATDKSANEKETQSDHVIVEKKHTKLARKGPPKTTSKTGTSITCLHWGVKTPEVAGSSEEPSNVHPGGSSLCTGGTCSDEAVCDVTVPYKEGTEASKKKGEVESPLNCGSHVPCKDGEKYVRNLEITSIS